MPQFEDLTGQRFGRLVCIEYAGKTGKNQASSWRCRCDCGNEKVVLGASLKRGRTTSCGCYQKEKLAENRPKDYSKINVKHGDSSHRSRVYNIWANMKQRCYNPNNPSYHWYGEKGITICDEWKEDYETFRDWASVSGYADNLTIDRIDSNGNYEPGNCQWLTQGENAAKAARKN